MAARLVHRMLDCGRRRDGSMPVVAQRPRTPRFVRLFLQFGARTHAAVRPSQFHVANGRVERSRSKSNHRPVLRAQQHRD